MPPPITIVPGRTFFPPGQGPNAHLQVVLSYPVGGSVFVVNVTDAATCPDLSVIVTNADHPALTKRSAAWFAMAKSWPEKTIQHHLSGANRRADASPALLAKLIAGCRKSHDLAPYMLEKYLSTPSGAASPATAQTTSNLSSANPLGITGTATVRAAH